MPRRRSIRLPGYDYSQPGAYFVTLVAFQRKPIFGEVRDEAMVPSEAGRVAAITWKNLPACFPHIQLDEWVVMPDHFHAIVWITSKGEASGSIHPGIKPSPPPDASPQPPRGTSPGSLGAILQNFKSTSTRRINLYQHTPGAPVWPRNYFERVIRSEAELNAIRLYIRDNPRKWQSEQDAH